jgi:hypothetical protein
MAAAVAVAAAVSAINDSIVRAPPDLVPVNQLPLNRVKIIKDAMPQVFGIHKPCDFQIEAVHYLTFHDNPSLVLLRHTVDGKSLIPLTTSIVRFTVHLFTRDPSLCPLPPQINNKFLLFP